RPGRQCVLEGPLLPGKRARPGMASKLTDSHVFATQQLSCYRKNSPFWDRLYGKQALNVTPGSSHAVVVGAGGNPDSSGGDSSFDSIIAHGGLYTAFGGKGGDCNATLNILGGPGVPIRYGVGGLGQGGAAACGGLGGVAATFYGASVSYGIVLTCPASNGQPPRGRWGWRRSDGRGSWS